MLAHAIQDCKQMWPDIDFESIAADYDLNPRLLERKFNESFPNGIGDPLPEFQTIVKARHDKTIARLEKEYHGILRDREVITFKTNKYTIVGYFSPNAKYPYLGVSHTDGRAYRLPRSAM